MKVHLVDGTYELFRAHNGAPPATGFDGSAVGATRGLLHTLLALLATPGVTHVACAFDHVIESFRNDLYDGYKTSEGVPAELLAQFPLAERLTSALGIVVWPMVEMEADDALATGAARWAADADVEQVVICSPDKDLAQCVRGARVVQLDRRAKATRDEAGVMKKFGVRPTAIPDWLALVGDSADGFPGLPGWGTVSAATVLARYGRLEDIPKLAGEWDVPVRGALRLATTLAEQREQALLFRVLATLREDAPLGVDVDGLRWRGPRPGFAAWAERLGAPALWERAQATARGR
jgi:5'-3' exonuclease